MKVKVTQSCPALCDPVDYTVHGILQARISTWAQYKHKEGQDQGGDVTMDAEVRVTQPHANKCRGLLKAGESKERGPPLEIPEDQSD